MDYLRQSQAGLTLLRDYCRAPVRTPRSFQVHASVDSQTHAPPPAEVKRPADLTQAIAVAAFLAVRYGSLHINAHVLLKSLAALQLLVAAVAMTLRNVQTDRVSAADQLL